MICRDRPPSPAGTSIPRGGQRLPAGPGRGYRQLPGGPVHPGRPVHLRQAAGHLAQREWSHPQAAGIPGSQSFDPAGNWALICACIREVLGSLPSPAAVRAVGCSAMGGGLVLYGRAGQELWACANGDTRAEREAAVMLADGTAAELYRRGGGWISLSAAPRLAWVRRHEPGVWAGVTRVSMIADWMVARLTGTLATEASRRLRLPPYSVFGGRAWSPELLNRCGLEPGLFPEVVEAGTVVGQVSAAASRQTGLAPGTPVVAGGLDTALGLTGPRPALPGLLTITGGSFWKQTVVAPAPAVDPAGCARSAMSGRASGWSRGSASTQASRSAGSATAPPAGQEAARRATPSWRNWPRRLPTPGRAASPPGWSRLMPGPGRAGSRRSRRGQMPPGPGWAGRPVGRSRRVRAGRPGWAGRYGPSRRPPPTPPAGRPGSSASSSVPARAPRSS